MLSVKLQGATTLILYRVTRISNCIYMVMKHASTVSLLAMLTQYLQPAHKRAVQCLYLRCKHSTCNPHINVQYSVSTRNVNTVSTTRTYTCSTVSLLAMLTQYLQPAHTRAVQCLYSQCKHSTCNPHIHVQYSVSPCNVNTVSTTRTYTCSTVSLLAMLTQYLQPAHTRAVQCLYLQ